MRLLGLGVYLLFYILPSLCLTASGQEEAFELIHLQEPNPSSPHSIAASVAPKDLLLVSSSVLAAETWLRSHVLAHYPSTNITTIVAGSGILCNKHHQQKWSLVLPTLKNLHHSLTRWGLSKDISLSAAFFSDCFDADAALSTLKPLLSFLQDSSFPYTISFSPKPTSMASAHQELLQRLGFSRLRDIRMIKGSRPMKRKLSSLHRSRSPPAFQFAPGPGSIFSISPFPSPEVIPASSPSNPSPTVVPVSPPDVSAEPPMQFCMPPVEVPAPAGGSGGGDGREKVGLWCVAKPTVPEEKLQEAMDFACGVGGADCEEIGPNGSCFNPDNSVAHASYAFNSYWQRTKQSGGSCSFDGTAILINSDPSFLHCRFELS